MWASATSAKIQKNRTLSSGLWVRLRHNQTETLQWAICSAGGDDDEAKAEATTDVYRVRGQSLRSPLEIVSRLSGLSGTPAIIFSALPRMARHDRPQHVGSELDDFEDELKEDADEHEDEIDPDVDEDDNEPAPSPAHRPDSLPPLLTNFLLPPLSLDEMRTKIEDDYYAVLLKSLLTRLIEAQCLIGINLPTEVAILVVHPLGDLHPNARCCSGEGALQLFLTSRRTFSPALGTLGALSHFALALHLDVKPTVPFVHVFLSQLITSDHDIRGCPASRGDIIQEKSEIRRNGSSLNHSPGHDRRSSWHDCWRGCRMSVKAEYLYISFNNQTIGPVTFTLIENVVRGGVNYRF